MKLKQHSQIFWPLGGSETSTLSIIINLESRYGEPVSKVLPS